MALGTSPPVTAPQPPPPEAPTNHTTSPSGASSRRPPGLPGPISRGRSGRAAPPGPRERRGGPGEGGRGEGADRNVRNEPGRSGRRRARRRERAARKVCVEEPGLGVGAAGKEGAGRGAGRARAARGGAARGRPLPAPGPPTPGLRDPSGSPLASPRPGVSLLARPERHSYLPGTPGATPPPPRFPAGIWGSGLGGAEGGAPASRAGLPSGPGPGCRVTRSPAEPRGARASGLLTLHPPSPERPRRSVLSGPGARTPDSRGPRTGPALEAAPALPEPGLSGSPREACFSNFSLSPSSWTSGALPLGPAPRGPPQGASRHREPAEFR